MAQFILIKRTVCQKARGLRQIHYGITEQEIIAFGDAENDLDLIEFAGIGVAMATVPDAGLPLFILLMSTEYLAMQVSPTHICLTLIAEYFDVSLSSMIKQTIPVLISFMVIAIAYYLIMITFFA